MTLLALTVDNDNKLRIVQDCLVGDYKLATVPKARTYPNPGVASFITEIAFGVAGAAYALDYDWFAEITFAELAARPHAYFVVAHAVLEQLIKFNVDVQIFLIFRTDDTDVAVMMIDNCPSGKSRPQVCVWGSPGVATQWGSLSYLCASLEPFDIGDKLLSTDVVSSRVVQHHLAVLGRAVPATIV